MEATASVARRRTPSALFVALAALTLTVLLGAAPARAADQCRPGAMLSPLPFSSFQGADGDQCNITGTAGSYDWQKIVTDGGFGSGGGTALIDNDTATGLNVFTGGSKEEKPKDWGFNSDFPNNKTNILAAWGYPDAQPNHLFLYLAFAREEASGSVNYNFELNQNPPSETFTTSSGATAIKRRAGDILIAYDRTGNSSVVINLCRWVPSNPAAAWLEGTWSTCTDLTASGLAQGETNLTFPVTNFLQGGGTLAAGQFGEAAIDLTTALNLGGPGQAPCADFGAFWVRSRQSGSITSDPSDFIPPSKVGVNNCGRVIIKKTTVGSATVPPSKFDFTANFNAVAEGMPDTTPAAFELGGGDTETVVKVQPGAYALAEADPTAKGYDLTGLTCTETGAVTNIATTTSLATRTATLNVDSGEEITCTYTNTRRGRIVVEKQTLPDGDPESFGFTTASGPFALTDGQTRTIEVLPGTHTVAEDAESGWSLSDLICDDTDSTGSTGTRTATYRVAAGETVTCTFTNTKSGRLIVEKQTLPDGDAASFGFTTTATGAGTFSLTDGATESRDVTPGSYTATENATSGWELTTLSCDDPNSTVDKITRTATFQIAPGETVTCTFTNTKDGRLIVEKQTLPDGDPASFGFTTTATGAGTFSLTDNGTESRDVKPGSYTATEDVKAGWELTGLTCDDQNSATDKPNRKATFEIAPGETVTCTFTNTKDGRLIVEKQTLPNGDGASFGFTTTATGAGSFSLTDGGTEARDVKPGSYTATEDVKAGWELTGLTCSDQNSATDKVARKATFDIAPGETVTCTFTNTKDGRLIVEKQTLPNGDGASFGFTTTATGAGTFSLTDNGTESRDVKPGSYTATEDLKAGWELTGLTCDDQNSATDKPNRKATFEIAPGETVTCTFTNTKDGRLIVEKQTLPNGDPAAFGFTTTATGAGTFSLSDNGTESRDVKPGSYTATENVKAGWELTGLSCDDQNSATDKPNRKATFEIAPGETVTCTFTNTKDGQLIIEKQTLPNGDPAAFGFSTDAPGAGTFSLTDGGTEERAVDPGTYVATEDLKAGWELTGLTCSDQNSATDKPNRKATFDISPGETVTCTFTNTKDGRLIVEKQTLPNGDGASFGFATTATGAGTFSLTDGATESRDVKPGSYTATEEVKSGWELTGLTCSDQNSATDKVARKATFDISPGETVTCTFTNTKDGRLIVEKQTLPNGDPASFGFTTTATGAGSFSLTDGGTEARAVDPGTYVATEDLKAGWELTGLTCDDQNSTTDKPNRKATFDISPGETVTCTFTNTKDARLVVEKQTLPNGDPATFSFDTTAPGAGTFSLGDNGTEGRDVRPGTYTATEGLKSGWELTDLTCDDTDSTTDKATRKATFVIAPGEHVTCTFTNTKDGRLIVEKQTLPDGDPTSFGFTTTATGAGTFSLSDGQTEERDVKPGTYTATEDAAAGYTLDALTCSDQNSTTSKATRKATFDISPGETVTCTFTNAKDGRLIVEKQTLPDGDPASFGFTTTATGNNAFSLTDGGKEERDVVPGTYTATEDVKAGWELTGLSCSDQNSTTDKPNRKATFDISPGETVTCTFTNTKDGRLIVEKQTLPDGDPASFGFTTTATGNGTFSVTDGGKEERDVVPGTYTATEDVKAGWELTGLSCSDQNSTTDKPNRKATFDIAPGETVTCTFTNTKDGRLIVEKQTLPDGDPTQFDFTTSATGAPAFKLADGAKESRDVKPGTYTAGEATATGFRLDQVACDDADSTGDKPSRTATYRIAPGETVTCTFLNRAISANAVVVKAGNEWAYHGDTLTFTFTVNNSGQSPLTNVTVSDNRCAPVTLKAKHDINGNTDTTPDVLDLTDTWIYECTMPAPAHIAGEPNPIVNTVTVGALDEFQRPVSDTDQHSTLLIHPAIAIDKTGPATAQAGQAVQYTLVVTNPGDVPFLAPNVNVADALCQAPPMLSTTNGDATPGQLDPGDMWTYTCTVQTLVGQTVVNNVAIVTGTDSYGGQDVTDEDPATTQLTQPPVTPPPSPPASITPSGTPVPRLVALPVPVATARLSGPKRCVSGPFETKVSGRNIKKVLFLLDGKKLRTVTNSANKTVFKVRINPRGQSSKAHRVVARVTFKAATRTRARTLRFIYLGCAKQAVAPQFTG